MQWQPKGGQAIGAYTENGVNPTFITKLMRIKAVVSIIEMLMVELENTLGFTNVAVAACSSIVSMWDQLRSYRHCWWEWRQLRLLQGLAFCHVLLFVNEITVSSISFAEWDA